MTPGIYNWTIYQGASDGLTFTVEDGGSPLDLTGYTARCMVRKNYDSANPLLSLLSTGVDPHITLTPLIGKVEIRVDPSQTSALPFKGEELECVYDVELVAGDGTVTRVLMGDATISREATR